MASSLKAQLKTLIAAKQYQAAIVLLEASDMPDKQAFIDRIKARMKEEAELKPAPQFAPEIVDKVKAKPRYSGRGVLGIVVFALVLLGVGTGLAINLMSRDAGKAIRLQFRMAEVCKDVFEDEYLAGAYTAAQLVNGCYIAAEHSLTDYEKEINYCADNFDQTDAIFISCLADSNVKIEEVWLLTAPKE
jgi:hypothetical protein